MIEHPFGWLSILPPVLAIALAIVTRRAVVSLFVGILAGALVTTGGDPVRAVRETLVLHLWPTIADPDKLLVFGFTLSMGAAIGIINSSGGMRGLVGLVTPWAKTRRRGQLATWLLGLLVFFDDYANTVLLGSTLRPLCDRLRISREKLAYLVDSTAAPVAGLALISTWVAVEVDYVQEGLNNLPVAEYRLVADGARQADGGPSGAAGSAAVRWPKAFDLFVETIPYRFYVLWALAFVPLVAILDRDFGPMLRAEQQMMASTGGARIDPMTTASPAVDDPTLPDPATPARWANAVVPLAACVGVIVTLMITTGKANVAREMPVEPPTLRAIFGQADSSYSLCVGSLVGLATATLLAAAQRLLSAGQLVRAAAAGARVMLPAILILWTASTLSRMTGSRPIPGYEANSANSEEAGFDGAGATASPASAGGVGADRAAAPESTLVPYRLYTGEFLTNLLGGWLDPWMLPTVVFVLASVVALSTGTSYGTMGILLPIVIPLSYGILAARGDAVRPDDPIFLASIGGVLAGSIFGDHCSPISDTTILSSQATGCDHVAHVWTQMPYALTVAAIAILFGTLPIGLEWNVWWTHLAGTGALAVLLWCVGKPVGEGYRSR